MTRENNISGNQYTIHTVLKESNNEDSLKTLQRFSEDSPKILKRIFSEPMESKVNQD